MRRSYKIEVDCANCANLMESAAKKVDGVRNAVVSFMSLRMTVDFEDECDPNIVMKQVLKACRKIEPDCEIYI